ncbi:THO complex subunit 1 transcription elongation factor-domain-containing protein [Lentinula aciculospora]|uniref:THO complex subunit 1 transcription elongation factor-domain-containing protein n=1 Tax=Lentinula aciculospora TaxID=153920 RepID=A0A9W9A060_9AGAR|nr:THO complex subunit 1 transcription elongation factor-domain-containing protein [Lentinula aciculospora]
MAKDTVEAIYERLLHNLTTSNTFQNTDALITTIEHALSDASTNASSSTDNQRMKWEYLIKRDVFQHATLEGKALASDNNEDAEKYYRRLQDWLDLALVFTELEATEPSYTFSVVQDLLETQTIPSCMKIFDWIERRSRDRASRTADTTVSTPASSSSTDLGSGRLTSGMQPQKGKALVLLRMLNDLLRRLSKAGGETIGFSGRILTYLSQVFPLGERSGVNLRGEYGPTWEMPVRETTENTDKDDFFNIFWSLQLPFSKPSVFATPNPPMTFAQFQDAVDKVLPVIKEATAKERAMMGAGRSAATMGPAMSKRKRGHDEERMDIWHGNGKAMEYFFAKFLTSPELLDLELADTQFRRQILFQLLIVLNHLLTHSKAEKPKWITNKNRSLYMPIPEWSLDDALNYGVSVDVSSTSRTGVSATLATGTEAAKDADKDKAIEKDAILSSSRPSSSAPIVPSTSTSTSAPNASTTTNTTTNPSSSTSLIEKTERMDPIKWTHLTISRTIEELRQTQPPPLASAGAIATSTRGVGVGGAGITAINGLTGREFASTVQSLLEREKGWIRWKNELCDGTVFERGVWEPSDELLESRYAVEEKDEKSMKLDGEAEEERGVKKKLKTMYEASRGIRDKMRGPFYTTEENQVEWKWDLGTEALTEIWAMGYRSLEDLERGFSPGTPHDFLRQLDLEDRKIEMRTKTLRAQQERRLQMERAAREKTEKAEAEEKESKTIRSGGDVDMKDAKETVGVIKKEASDVEMKPSENEPSVSKSAPTTKTEILPQPMPVRLSDQLIRPSTPSRTLIHPSLPPKPGSRPVSPAKPATPVANGPSMSTTSESGSTSVAGTKPITAAISPVQATTVRALPQDEQIRKAEESKTRITWLALRTARDSAQGHLVHFSKIGAGDVRMLCEEIDKAEREREEKEKTEKEEREGLMAVDSLNVDTESNGKMDTKKEEDLYSDPSGLGFAGSPVLVSENEKVDREGDVRME